MACRHFDVIDRLPRENWYCCRQRNRSGRRCHSEALVESSADAGRYSVGFVAIVVVVSIAVDADASYYTDLTNACRHFAPAATNCLVAFGDFVIFAFAATTGKTTVFAGAAHRHVR